MPAQFGNLAPVQRGRGHQHPGVTQAQPLLDRLRTEGGEQRAEDGAVLERAEGGDIQLRDPACEHEHALAGAHAEPGQDAREPVGLELQLRIGDLGRRVALAEETQRHRVGRRALRLAVDRLVRDVEPPPGSPASRPRAASHENSARARS